MSKFSVKKPFTVLVMVIVIIILGVVSLSSMTTDLLPEMNLPYMIVITTYPGASPEKVETAVCEPMERALGSVSGVKNVYSMSYENYGIVQLEFVDGTNMDSAMVKVSSSLDAVEAALPDECGTPTIMEISMDMMASVYLAVAYEGMDIQETSRFVEDTVIPYLERQEGITSISSIGLVENSIVVELNEEKVEELNNKILAKADEAFEEATEQMEEAAKQLEDAEKTLEDSKQEMTSGQKELNAGKKELEEGKQGLEDGKKELEAQQDATFRKLAETKRDLLTAKTNLESMKTSLTTNLALVQQIDAALTRMQSGTDIVATAPEKYQALMGPYAPGGVSANGSGPDEAAKAEVTSLRNEYMNSDVIRLLKNSGDQGSMAAVTAAITTLETTDWTVPDNYNTVYMNLQIVANVAPTLSGMLNALTGGLDSVEYAKTVNENLQQINVGLAQVNAGLVEVEKGELEAALGFAEASSQISMGEYQMGMMETQLNAAQEQLNTGKDSLEDAEKQIEDGWKEYYDALENLEIQRAEVLRSANADRLLDINTLAQLIYAQNFAMPAGYVDDREDNSWLLKIGTNFESVEELSDVVLVYMEGVGDVRLKDVADVTVIDNADASYARLDGNEGIILSVFKGSTAGTNEVSRNVEKAVAQLTEEYPGLSVMTLVDQGDYITMIINGVLQSMIVGAILAVIVLALFLKDVKPTIVVAVSIPLSVLTALVLMYFSGISLNMMSLSGLALGIGMLVDNSIVVIENIYRLRTKGVAAARASVQGTKQVAGAIISSTLTTVSVFAPMIFTTGTVRELMMPISLTIIFTLCASLLIAMTVVPATGSTLLKNSVEKKHPWFEKIQDAYGKLLAFCLKVKVVPLAIAIGFLVFSIWAVVRMGIVMIPEMTSNQIQIAVQMPEDAEKDACYEMADQVMDAILSVDGVESVGAMSGGAMSLVASTAGSGSENFTSYSFMVITENEDAGEDEVKRICADIMSKTSDIGCQVSVSTGMEEMSTMMGSGLSINVYGSDLNTLKDITEDIMEMVDTIDGFTDISNGQEEPDQVIHLILNRDAAMRQGLTAAQIFAEISGSLAETATAATVTVDGVEMEIVVKDIREPLTRENILDYNFEKQATDENGNSITEDHPLSEFAEIRIEDGVQSIQRENQSRYMTVTASVEEGYNATLLARELEPLLEQYQLPSGYSFDSVGESDTVNQMIVEMMKVLLMGLAFIYLVMVAQFQSLLSPFIVLFTVPLAFTGGLIGLLLMGEPLSVMGMMGFVVLLGTVVNNGIVFVDYANQLRIGGLERRDALIATGKTRMRPILMTALTTILAMASLLFGDDLSSQMSRGMAIVVSGGLAYATLMTLFIIPVMYDILFKKNPVNVDIGREDLDDVPDDAADYLRQKAENAEKEGGPERVGRVRRKRKKFD
ncbi:MAG: efflux RND transporter permease subunit [Butyrivibrio sp.]|nr:efflux RND transporter permease subunit [Acetatifactor muris]MCM1560045.1 efflux RND transporter permease subunit [Butyrivibrio sp.]